MSRTRSKATNVPRPTAQDDAPDGDALLAQTTAWMSGGAPEETAWEDAQKPSPALLSKEFESYDVMVQGLYAMAKDDKKWGSIVVEITPGGKRIGSLLLLSIGADMRRFPQPPPSSPRDVYGGGMLTQYLRRLSAPDTEAALEEVGNLHSKAKAAAESTKSFLRGLCVCDIALFIKVGGTVEGVLLRKKTKGLATARKTAALEGVQQALRAATAMLRPGVRDAVMNIATLARAATQRNQVLPDECATAVSAVTEAFEDADRCLEAMAEHSQGLIQFMLWLYPQRVCTYVAWAKKCGLFGPAMFSNLWPTFRQLADQTVAARRSCLRIVEQALETGALKEKGEGFTAASIKKQLAAQAALLMEDFVPPHMVRDGQAADDHQQHMEASVDHLAQQVATVAQQMAAVVQSQDEMRKLAAKLEAFMALYAGENSEPLVNLPRHPARLPAATRGSKQAPRAPRPTPAAPVEQPIAAAVSDLVAELSRTYI